MSKPKLSQFNKVILVILLISCVLGVLYSLSLIVRFATSPNQMDFGEGFTTYISYLWANGEFNWNPAVAPYETLIYGTVFPSLMSPFIHLFGPDLRIGRAFSILATAIIAFLIYLIARRYTKNKIIPIVAALLPFTYFGYQEWIMQTRCDMTAICFEVIGLYIALRWWNAGNKVLWSIPFVLLAFFTKQSIVTVGLAIGIGLLISNRRMFIKYASILAVSGLLIISVGNLLTDGQFIKQLFNYNVTTPFFNVTAAMVQVYFMILFPLALEIGLAIAYVYKKHKEKLLNLPAIWVVVALMVNGAMLLRYASFVNYVMEAVIAMGLVMALYFDTKLNHKIMIVSAGIFQMFIIILFWSTQIHFIPMPDKDYQSRIDKVVSIIQDTDKPIYTEQAGLLLNAGKVPYFEPFIYNLLMKQGVFDEQVLIKDLDGEAIEYIVLQRPGTLEYRGENAHITNKAMEAIAQNYTVVYDSFDKSDPRPTWYSYTVYESNKKLAGR